MFCRHVRDQNNKVALTVSVAENSTYKNSPIDVRYYHDSEILYSITEAEDFVATLQRAIEVAKNMNKPL
jgi:hypothetical protein